MPHSFSFVFFSLLYVISLCSNEIYEKNVEYHELSVDNLFGVDSSLCLLNKSSACHTISYAINSHESLSRIALSEGDHFLSDSLAPTVPFILEGSTSSTSQHNSILWFTSYTCHSNSGAVVFIYNISDAVVRTCTLQLSGDSNSEVTSLFLISESSFCGNDLSIISDGISNSFSIFKQLSGDFTLYN